MKITIEARTDVGRVRELNEDSYRVLPERNAVVVCDGMGGHAAGEIASAIAADTISELMREQPDTLVAPVSSVITASVPQDAVRLAAAVRIANRRLYIEASRSNKLRGMGTTVVAAVFADGILATAHVGDSRAYRITEDAIEQLTIDHSWIAELVQSGQVKLEDAERFADKNVITRALGTRPNVQVDVGLHPVQDGDTYLLCSDGLCGFVSDQDIHVTIKEHGDDLGTAAEALIAAANAAGGLDNSTVALVRVQSTDGSPDPKDTSDQSPDLEGTLVGTLPEETEEELAVIDELITARFPNGAEASSSPDGSEPSADSGEAKKVRRKQGSRGRWAWLVLLLVVLLLAAVLLWPRPDLDDSPVRPSSDTSVDTPEAPADGARGIVYLVGSERMLDCDVYWNGIRQGYLRDFDAGLLVDAGVHDLAVLSGADTILHRSVVVSPDDTVSIPVR